MVHIDSLGWVWLLSPDVHELSGQLTQLLQIFRSMTQIFVKSAEMKITIPFSLLLNLLYYTIEKCRFESPLWHSFFMEICLIFYSYYIVTRWYTYTMLAMYVLYVLVLFYKVIIITNLLTLKLRRFHSDSNQRPFALLSDSLSITPSDPEAPSDIFGYILAFSLISTWYWLNDIDFVIKLWCI